jgi:hypothetical protein
MARHELVDPLVAGERRGDVAEGQVVVQRLEVRLAVEPAATSAFSSDANSSWRWSAVK